MSGAYPFCQFQGEGQVLFTTKSEWNCKMIKCTLLDLNKYIIWCDPLSPQMRGGMSVDGAWCETI